MAFVSFAQFTELHLSVLQELGNMGSGGAATALATMLNTPTDISCPAVRNLKRQDAEKLITTLCKAAHPLLIDLSGDFAGHILHLLPYSYVNRIVGNFFPGVNIKGESDIDEMANSVINESVNITSAAYANSLAQLSGMFVDISTPSFDGKSLSKIFSGYSPQETASLFVNNTMIIKDVNQTANMVFFPEIKSVCKMIEKMGIPCE